MNTSTVWTISHHTRSKDAVFDTLVYEGITIGMDGVMEYIATQIERIGGGTIGRERSHHALIMQQYTANNGDLHTFLAEPISQA